MIIDASTAHLHNVLALTNWHINQGDDAQAYEVLQDYYKGSVTDQSLCETLYQDVDIKYVIFAYRHKPCPKFMTKRREFCIAHGLDTDKDYIDNYTMRDFVNLFGECDLQTVFYFAKVLIEKDKFDFRDVRKNMSKVRLNPIASVWMAICEEEIANWSNERWSATISDMGTLEVLSLVSWCIDTDRDDLAYQVMQSYRWGVGQCECLCETLYHTVDIKYVLFAYRHMPCSKFKTKYTAFCIAHGLDTDDDFIANFTMRDFTNLIKDDFHTIMWSSNLLLTKHHSKH